MTQTRTNYSSAGYDVYVGIDVDKKSFATTFKDAADMSYSKQMPAEPAHLHNYIKKHFSGRRVLCVYEAGPTGYHLYDYMNRQGQDCIVTPPIAIRRAPNEKVKNNRLDSIKLAQELRSGNLKVVRVPEEAYRELRQLIGGRENYAVAARTAKQRIKALLLYNHIDAERLEGGKHCSGRYISGLKALECSPCTKTRLELLISDLEYARRQTLIVLKQLRAFFREHKELDAYRGHLQSIPGVGFVIAATILARVGDPACLCGPREMGGFLGLVPRESSTGERVIRGSVTHLGNSVLRSLLVEAAWVAIKRDNELGQFYYRVKARHHPRIGARKAIVAVARKLTHRLYCVLKERRDYIAR